MTLPPGNPRPGGGEPPKPGPKPPFTDDAIFAAVEELRADLGAGFELPLQKAFPAFGIGVRS